VGTPEAGPDLVDLGRTKVDLRGHRLLTDGQPVPLKPRAFQLLAFFVRNPGQVFTRDQLLQEVWGTDYPGETRTVDVHVRMLRTAIETDPANPVLLETVRGVGYVFRLPRG
jgi:DNA-binding response OmpR family regulator